MDSSGVINATYVLQVLIDTEGDEKRPRLAGIEAQLSMAVLRIDPIASSAGASLASRRRAALTQARAAGDPAFLFADVVLLACRAGAAAVASNTAPMTCRQPIALLSSPAHAGPLFDKCKSIVTCAVPMVCRRSSKRGDGPASMPHRPAHPWRPRAQAGSSRTYTRAPPPTTRRARPVVHRCSQLLRK